MREHSFSFCQFFLHEDIVHGIFDWTVTFRLGRHFQELLERSEDCRYHVSWMGLVGELYGIQNNRLLESELSMSQPLLFTLHPPGACVYSCFLLFLRAPK